MGVVVPPFQGRGCVREVVLCTRKRAGWLVLDEARDDANLDGRGARDLTWFRSIGPSTGQSSGITYFGGGRKFGFPTAFFFVDPAGAFVAARSPFFGEEIESARGDAMITIPPTQVLKPPSAKPPRRGYRARSSVSRRRAAAPWLPRTQLCLSPLSKAGGVELERSELSQVGTTPAAGALPLSPVSGVWWQADSLCPSYSFFSDHIRSVDP